MQTKQLAAGSGLLPLAAPGQASEDGWKNGNTTHLIEDPCMVDIYLQYPTIYQYLHIFTIKLNHSCRIHVPVP